MLLPAPVLLLGALLAPQQASDTVPLFASDDPVEFTVVTDLEAIRKDRAEEQEERPGALILPSGDTVEAEFRARGHFRRDPSNCSFPPLRVDVKKKSAKGTVFQGQDKLKLVSPCRPERSDFAQFVLLEYSLYKVYQLFTDQAFKVRLAKVTFVDTGGGREPFTTSAFFIEDEDAMDARLGGTKVEVPEGAGVSATYLEPRQTQLVSLFQYMIGNTDWSDQALHNVKLARYGRVVRPIPYDFDFSGIVNTPYATPDPSLGTRTVRERVYRGWCFDPATREGLTDELLAKREQVEAVFSAIPGLEEKSAKNAVSYLKRFWELIDTPDRAEKRIFKDCKAVR